MHIGNSVDGTSASPSTPVTVCTWKSSSASRSSWSAIPTNARGSKTLRTTAPSTGTFPWSTTVTCTG